MGNCKSCFYAEPPTAKLIEVDGNIRQIKLPITAAEIMLDDPGHVLSPAQQIRLTSRISAMKADEGLSAGKVYLLVQACRIHCKASESEMALVDSFTGEKRRRRRRSSKVLPAVPVTDGSGEKVESPIPVLQGNGTGLAGHRMGTPKQWRPVLDPIHEGI